MNQEEFNAPLQYIHMQCVLYMCLFEEEWRTVQIFMNDRTYYKTHLQALTSCPISPRTSPFLEINSKYLHYHVFFLPFLVV